MPNIAIPGQWGGYGKGKARPVIKRTWVYSQKLQQLSALVLTAVQTDVRADVNQNKLY